MRRRSTARIPSVLAERGLVTYRTLAQVDRYSHGADIFLRDVLTHFDLPHVAAAVRRAHSRWCRRWTP